MGSGILPRAVPFSSLSCLPGMSWSCPLHVKPFLIFPSGLWLRLFLKAYPYFPSWVPGPTPARGPQIAMPFSLYIPDPFPVTLPALDRESWEGGYEALDTASAQSLPEKQNWKIL